MFVRKAKISPISIEYTTNRNKQHAESAINRVNRFLSEKSGVNGTCKYCSYLYPDRIGGAAVTNTACGICDQELTFGSTNVDCLCISCAAENLLCRHCGGDIDMKIRRKPRQFQIESEAT